MTYLEWYKQSKEYAPVLRLLAIIKEESLSKINSLLSVFVALLLLIFGGVYLLSLSPNLVEFIPTEGKDMLNRIFNSQGTGFALLEIFVALKLFIIALLGFIRSFRYRGYEMVFREKINLAEYVDFASAEIILAAQKRNPLLGFLNTQRGRIILFRAGFTLEVMNSIESQIIPKFDENREIEGPITLGKLAEFVGTIPENVALLRGHAIKPEYFIESAKWIERQRIRDVNNKRKWGRYYLNQFPGIGVSLSYGQTYLLDKYAKYATGLDEYRSIHLDSPRSKKEADQVVEGLLSAREANVLLLGHTQGAMREVLARIAKQINTRAIHTNLRHKVIRILDIRSMVSATGNKQDFEIEFGNVLYEVAKAGNIILFIEDIEIAIEDASQIGSNLLSLLAPFAESSRLQLILSVTPEVFHRRLDTNPLLREHFNIVEVNEPTTEEYIVIVEDAAKAIERRTGVLVTYPALATTVDAADRLIVEGVMPDRAIDLLYGFASSAHAVLTKKDVEDGIHQKTGVPIGEVTAEERSILVDLAERLHKRVIGQESAVVAISSAIKRSRAGIESRNKPIGSFLFLGPTGVGKTEVSKALAQEFFGDANKMVRFDMSEYSGPDALDRLIGISSGSEGALVSRLIAHPYTLLLLDEFEKATRSVHDLFLQILDEGMFTSTKGRQVNARNTIIIATSNAGAQHIWDLFQEGKDPAEHKDELIDYIVREGIYRPELLNRFDDTIVFHPLDLGHLEKIAEIMLQNTQKKILERTGITINFSPGVASYIAINGADPEFGARPLAHYITEKIESLVADLIIQEGYTSGNEIQITEEKLNTIT